MKAPLKEAIQELEGLLGKSNDDAALYATMDYEEAQAMGDIPADDWYKLSRSARAHKVATRIAERRKERYYALKQEYEFKLKHG